MGLIRKIKEYNKASHLRRLEERAREIFQICEYDNKLWYTCNGMLVCQCEQVVHSQDWNDAIALLENMRNSYIERNK